MNLNSDLFPSALLSETEKTILVSLYSNPVFQKHIRMMAMEDTKELLRYSTLSHADSEVVKALATVQGKLAAYQTLLSIPAINNQE